MAGHLIDLERKAMKRCNSVVGLLVMFLFVLSCSRSTTAPDETVMPWSKSTPEKQGFNKSITDSLDTELEKHTFIDGYLIVRHGKIVYERYYNTYNAETGHVLISVTKSVLSTLVGIAIEQGHIDSLDQKMMDLLPEYRQLLGVDQRINEITIRHLLNMTTGFMAPDVMDIVPGHDLVEQLLRLSFRAAPGTQFQYSDFTPHFLSKIISRNTGQSAFEYADDNLKEAAGIVITDWTTDAQGINAGGSGCSMTPRSMARLGWLYLNRGQLNGESVLPEAWAGTLIEAALSRSQFWQWEGYGYLNLWWLHSINEYAVVSAMGRGGQLIHVFPELDMVVVATAAYHKDDRVTSKQSQILRNTISRIVLQAVTH